ncbi:sulfite exporter TauE/SafE family protein [Desertihabitans aurantiacus]|uniref:sulfite exporter TauE/SafE family protein n=1 Tax=Desertihabitans aurantiacus TaxID=2282477 RepID=UPI001E490751|nr:sulfite exporter TauE/SafE family protein [Desertihabitans aurantiacus]
MIDPVELLLVLLAGVGAGAVGAVVGSGTLVTFPVLIAFGYPPVVATMTNAVGQVAGGVSGWWGYRRETAGQGRRLLRLLPASVLGAVLGSWLLLHLPERVFRVVVPVLLVLALVLVLAQPRIQAWSRRRAERRGTGSEPRPRTVRLTLLVFAIGVYGGYFTAAQGILLIAALGLLLPERLQVVNALKVVLTLAVNVVAAAVYAVVAHDEIVWPAAAAIAAGTLVGGGLGATVGRRLPAPALRGVIVVVGAVGIWRLLATG